MIHGDRFSRSFFATLLVLLTLPYSTLAQQRIKPLRTRATFSSEFPDKRWSVPISATDGSTVYVLSLVPDFDVRHRVVTAELILHRSRDKNDAANLLDPTGTSHGLQAYDFAARDLVQGIQNSAFGEKRTLSLKKLGLLVQVVVSRAVVKPTSEGDYQLDALELQIEVDNSKQ